MIAARPERILCIRLSGLGDVVHALNALSLLRRERPDAHIAWAVEDRFADLLRGHPYVDELVVVPYRSWRPMLGKPPAWQQLAREVRRAASALRSRGFGASVDFQSSIKSAWLVWGARARMRIGFGGDVSREFNLLVQNRCVRVATARVHRIERDLELLRPLGIGGRYAPPVLPVSRADAEAMDQALAGLLTGGPMVVIHPGTSRFAAFKRWDPARYACVADALVAERRADVLLTHGPEDRDLAEEVRASMRERGALAPPTRTLQQLAHLLSKADLFIGGDTGPMHVASALGAPVVALFGPKDPVQTGPYCSRSIAITGDADCRPCTRRRCPRARCMATIEANQVLAAARAALDGGGTCRAPDSPPRDALIHYYEPA